MTPTQGIKNREYNRELLLNNRTYYVRTNGNDSNDGLSNTSGGAFLTLQGALDNISDSIDSNGYDVTIQLADGTYTDGCILRDIVGASTGGNFYIKGNSSTPSNVVVSATSASAFSSYDISTIWQISDMKITTVTSGHCISTQMSTIYFSNINFGPCANQHLSTTNNGYIVAKSNYSITGSAYAHINPYGSGGVIDISGKTVTITGTPSFTYFAFAVFTGAIIATSNTFAGSATGSRYLATIIGTINTNGGGANYFPGNTAGSTSNGGQYI